MSQKQIGLAEINEVIDAVFSIDTKCFCPHCKKQMGCYKHFCESCKERVSVPDEEQIDYQQKLKDEFERRVKNG